MNQVTFFQAFDWEDNAYEMAKIDRGNNEFTIMPKSVYDEQQAALKDK